MIGEETYNAVKDKVVCRWLSILNLKGKTKPMNVYEVLCPVGQCSDKIIGLANSHMQLKELVDQERYFEAIQLCREMLNHCSSNISAKELLDRLLIAPEYIAPLHL
jgi:hypothetical protein